MSNHISADNRESAWRDNLRKSLTAKQRTSIPRAQMPELTAEERVHSFEEVNRGLTAEQAFTESQRCLDCPDPQCVTGCPVNIDIPGFIKNIERGETDEALKVIRRTSSLPAVCGRVCPQEKQCESRCIYNKMKRQPVAIGYLERYVADNGKTKSEKTTAISSRGKIAVAGSGPAGLTFAGDMAKLGYEVTVFEALHQIGGVLKYGIPQFRLPNSIVDNEIESLQSVGVNFVKNCIVGKTISYDDLIADGYKALFVASGAGLPRFMGIPGENLIGVLSCNEYLTRINLMGAGSTDCDTPVWKGKNVAVIGGGNTAMDAVRTARRMGAERAMIVYRRSLDEMPARAEEVKHAREEGVEFLTLHNPIEYHGDDSGHITSMRLQVMELGEPDSSGRRAPVAVEGKQIDVPVDMVIVSVGVSPNPLIPSAIDGLDVSRKGCIIVDETTMQSSMPLIYAGGDIVRGGATVILAMGDGRRAAAAVHEMLGNKK
ncbi:MAG: NADPH-dependent glutamate synthase [Paramuribaculum sp.]|nr:NADPH-dependent glutamate synthase [Paramuribaculum sp.]